MSRDALPTEADFPFWTEETLRIADTGHSDDVDNGAAWDQSGVPAAGANM